MLESAGALTSEQRAIIEAQSGPVLVTAGVGCGKTHVLAERAARALDRGQPASGMLALTFTNRAAWEMRERLAALVGPAAGAVAVSTFHGFCARVLRRDGKVLAIEPSFIVWDDVDRREAVRLAAGRVGLPHDAARVKRWARQIADLKQQKVYPQTWRGGDGRFLALYQEYQHLLQTSNALDFDDLIVQTWTLFRCSPGALERWADALCWMEVDEFQDTSDLEYEILHLLARGHQNVCVFGDPDQWIYRFRGVDGERVVARFAGDFPHHRRLPLTCNFRSPRAVLGAARAIMTPTRAGAAPVAITWDQGEAVRVRACPTEAAERAYVARRVREFHAAGVPWPRIAVLTRTNWQLGELAAACNMADVPITTAVATEIFRRPEVKDLAAYLRLIAEPHDVLALRRIANAPPRDLPPAYLTELEREGRACGLLLTDLVDETSLLAGDPCADDLDVAGRSHVVIDVEATGLDVASDEIITLAAVRVDGATGERARFESLVRPSRSVGASTAVHGCDDATLQTRGRDPTEALAAFRTFVGRLPLVGHNIAAYDVPLLDANLRRVGLPALRNRTADTLWLARRVLDLDRYDLGRVGRACAVAEAPTHRALDDAVCTAGCFQALAAHLREGAAARQTLVARARARFLPLARLIGAWRDRAGASVLSELVERVLTESGYLDHLRRQGAERRLLALEEIRGFVAEHFDPLPPERGLRALLDYFSLARNADRAGVDADSAYLLTIHAAKGLEFDAVIIAGVHDDGLPAYWSRGDREAVEEERRLLYVGMTRARRLLELTYSQQRALPSGTVLRSRPSRFLSAAPPGVFVTTRA